MTVDVSDYLPCILEKGQYLYAKALVEELFRQFGIEHHPTAFRNRKISCYRYATLPQIILGYESVDRAYAFGFLEYKSIRWIWGDTTKCELEGVHRLVLHEFAHVLQAQEPDGRQRGSIHNSCFVECLRELQVTVPFKNFGEEFLQSL